MFMGLHNSAPLAIPAMAFSSPWCVRNENMSGSSVKNWYRQGWVICFLANCGCSGFSHSFPSWCFANPAEDSAFKAVKVNTGLEAAPALTGRESGRASFFQKMFLLPGLHGCGGSSGMEIQSFIFPICRKYVIRWWQNNNKLVAAWNFFLAAVFLEYYN